MAWCTNAFAQHECCLACHFSAAVSPNHQLLAYTVDFTGDGRYPSRTSSISHLLHIMLPSCVSHLLLSEVYELVIKDLGTGKNLPDSVKRITGCATLQFAFGSRL